MSTTMTATPPVDPRHLRRVARALDAALWLVALAVGVYSLANVHAVAVGHGTGDPQAWLLAPIVDVALFGGITADSVLSRHRVKPSGWGTALRWFCGGATWTLNVWDAAASGDLGAIVTHSVPPVVLILLAEAAPRYRQQFAQLVHTAPAVDPVPVPAADAPPAVVVAPVPVDTVPTPAAAPSRKPASKRGGTGATPRSAGRKELARLVAKLPADDPRSERQLAADLAPAAGVAPTTARRYLAELRRTGVPA